MPTKKLVTRYEQDLVLFPDRWHKIGLALGIPLALLFPFLVNDHLLTIGNLTLITIVGAIALMILTGFTGQISLGHAAFLAAGAYTAAILGRFGVPFWLVLPAAGLLAAAIGLAVGPFALRLQGLYLAIVTIGLLFLVRHVLLSVPALTGGVAGTAVPMQIWFTPAAAQGELSAFTQDTALLGLTITFEQKLYLIFLVIAVATMFVGANIRRTDTGRTFMAVRDHDLAAAALGVNPATTKIVAFGLSSFLAGVAGAMFAFQQQYITVDPFNLQMSVVYIAVIILGGMGTTFGAVAGAIFFSAVAPLGEAIGAHLPLLDQLSSGQQSALIFSALVIAFLMIEAMGLFGLWLRIKRYFVAWPFRY